MKPTDKSAVGNFHFNHFIRFFDIKTKASSDAEHAANAKVMTKVFYDQFCGIFSRRNIASAKAGTGVFAEFEGCDTIEFVIGGNVGTDVHKLIGALHPDWVFMEKFGVSDGGKQMQSFCGNTLKRLKLSPTDQSIVLVTKHLENILKQIIKTDLKDSPISEATLTLLYVVLHSKPFKNLIAANQKHFLAGTRSWMVGYDAALKCYFVETCTIERYSDVYYALVDVLGMLPFAHDLRKDIELLWAHLLDSFIESLQKIEHGSEGALIGIGIDKLGAKVSEIFKGGVGYKPSSINFAEYIPRCHFIEKSFAPNAVNQFLAAKENKSVIDVLSRHPGATRHLVAQQRSKP